MAIFDKLLQNDDYEEEQTRIDGYIDFVRPKSYQEAVFIVKDLMQNHAVIINTSETDDVQRLYDYISGAILALGGNMKKVSKEVAIFTPASLSMEQRNFDEPKRLK